MIPNDELLFLEEEIEKDKERKTLPPWKMLVVDDDAEVCELTRMVLERYNFENRALHFIDAYSGEGAKRLIQEHPDTALILLDVVMEKEDSGLEVVRYIREELKNKLVRIVLRTGQPGQAPENQVILEYDINDYKEKTELTAQKLFTTVTAALRGYRDLQTIEKSKVGLEKIIDSSAALFELKSLKKFASGLLTQIAAMISFEDGSLFARSSALAAASSNEGYKVLAGSGEFAASVDLPLHEVVSPEVFLQITRVSETKQSYIGEDHYVGFFESENNCKNLLYMDSCRCLDELEVELLQILETNISVAFDNIYLNEEIIETQKEVVLTLGEIVETRSQETANHVQRVGEFAYLLAKKYGMDETEAELLRLASPMHDVGKIGISDLILCKPGKLTREEFELVKKHSLIGYEILRKSHRQIMNSAAIIALQHHERWDGLGYPNGLKEEEIHIYGRIVCIADVFDALCHKRIYKDAWDIHKVLLLFQDERGRNFDPNLIDLFFYNCDEFVQINEKFP